MIVLHLTFCVQTAQARPGVATTERPAHAALHTPSRTASCTRPAGTAVLLWVSSNTPPGGGSLRGRGRLWTTHIGPKRFVYPGAGSAERRGAVGTASHGLQNLLFPRRKSTATPSPEPDIGKKVMAPVEAGELGSVLLLASLRE